MRSPSGFGVESLVGIRAPRETASIRGLILAGAEHHLDGIAEGIDERVNFGRQSAAGSPDGLRTVFFWASLHTRASSASQQLRERRRGCISSGADH
jgi:hypothetical protein